jgi:hypothetical protein
LNNNLKKEISNIKQDFEEYKTESIIANNENIKKNKMKKEKNTENAFIQSSEIIKHQKFSPRRICRNAFEK